MMHLMLIEVLFLTLLCLSSWCSGMGWGDCGSVYVFYVLFDICKCDGFMCFELYSLVVVVE